MKARAPALSDDSVWMREALAEAAQAAADGDVPVGCVLTDGSRVVARGRNRRELDNDPTAHAELVALRAAAALRGHWRLDDLALVVTLEPCAMCAGALVNARVPLVIYGATDAKGGAVHSHFGIGVGATLNHRFEVRAGVLAEECAGALKAFFGRLRAEGQK